MVKTILITYRRKGMEFGIAKSPGKGNRLTTTFLTDKRYPPSGFWSGLSKGPPTPNNVGNRIALCYLPGLEGEALLLKTPHILVTGLGDVNLVLT